MRRAERIAALLTCVAVPAFCAGVVLRSTGAVIIALVTALLASWLVDLAREDS